MVIVVDSPKRVVLWDGDVVWPEGLFPTQNPHAKVYCPAHHLLRSWVVQSLTLIEVLRVYQLPASMDEVFEHMSGARFTSCWGDHQWILPFKNALSPSILASIAPQLWGVDGGGGKGQRQVI